MPPKTAPIPRKVTASTRTPGTDRAEACRWEGAGIGVAHRGLGAALRGEEQPADQSQRGLRDQTGRRVHAGAQRGGEHRADDEGELVRHRFEGGRGGHQRRGLTARRRAEHRSPAGPHHRPYLRNGRTRRHGGDEHRPQGRVRQRQRRQHRDGRRVHQDAGQQHGTLAEAVGELAGLRREQGHGDTGHGGDGARAAVRAGGVLDQKHDADGQHREGLPCGEARKKKCPRTRGAQQLPVTGAVGDRGRHGPCLSAAWWPSSRRTAGTDGCGLVRAGAAESCPLRAELR